MRSSSFAAILGGPALVAAVDLLGLKPREEPMWIAKETGGIANVELGVGTSPRPTEAPRPQYGQMELVKRISGFTMSSDTCGYIASANSNAFTCVRVGASCTNDKKFMGCCSATGTEGHTGLKTSCVPFSLSASVCASLKDFHTLCCSSEKPLCHSYAFSTTASPGITVTLLACDTKTGSGTLLDYPPAFTRSSSSSSVRTTSSSRSSSSSSSSSTSSGAPTSANPATASAPTGPSDTAAPVTAPAAQAPVGAIVGGTVGGVAVIALAAAAILFLRRRDKKADGSGSSTVTGPMQPAPIAGPGGKFFYQGQATTPASGSIMSGSISHQYDARYSVVPPGQGPMHSPQGGYGYDPQAGGYDPHASMYGGYPSNSPHGASPYNAPPQGGSPYNAPPHGGSPYNAPPHGGTVSPPPAPVGGPFYAGTPPPQYPPQHGAPPTGGYQSPQGYGHQYR